MFSSDDSDHCRFLGKQKRGDPIFSRFLNEPGTGFNDFNHDGQEWIGGNRIRSYIFSSDDQMTCEGKPRARPGGISWSQSTRKADAKFMQLEAVFSSRRQVAKKPNPQRWLDKLPAAFRFDRPWQDRRCCP